MTHPLCRLSRPVLVLGACFLSVSAPGASALPVPEIFAPGVISGPANDGAPTFSPDGKSLLFTRSGANGVLSVILESHETADGWTQPTVASFSGQWYDSSAAISKDGRYVVFQSTRPWSTDKKAPRGSHLWRCERTASGWSEPRELPAAVNVTLYVYRPSVGTDGALYYIAKGDPDKKFQLYMSAWKDNAYQPGKALSFSDGSTLDVDPEISNDGSYLLFASLGRAPFSDGHEHLYIVRSKDGAWGAPEAMRYEGDTWDGATVDDDPRLSPDDTEVYFTSDRSKPIHYPLTAGQANAALKATEWDNGNANVWRMPMAPYTAH